MNTAKKRFAICIDNTDYEVSLIIRKIYEVISDERAEKDNFFRVIDEIEEDYLYHRNHFILIEVPVEVEQALTSV